MGLKKYHRKRDFDRIRGPYSSPQFSQSRQLLFVIQKHAASRLHYDFRLEIDGVLKSWAIPKGPSLDPNIKHLAVHVEDHPLEYATFEGTIPKGEYGSGTVMIWDYGTWEPLEDKLQQAYSEGDLHFVLHGQKLRGGWKLIRLNSGRSEARDQWLLFKVKDQYSKLEKDFNITEQAPYSSKTNRSMQQIAEQQTRVWTREGEIQLLPKNTGKKS